MRKSVIGPYVADCLVIKVRDVEVESLAGRILEVSQDYGLVPLGQPFLVHQYVCQAMIRMDSKE